jgi:peptidoglycan/xylan/chitin deacetylase (PgdA/CDA1 family)
VALTVLALVGGAIVFVFVERSALGAAPKTGVSVTTTTPSGTTAGDTTAGGRQPAPPTTVPLAWSRITTTTTARDSTSTLPAFLPTSEALHVPILTYHYVDTAPPMDSPYANDLTVRTHSFEQQMDYLARSGFNTVTLPQVYLALAGLAPLPPRPVALTFDDGGLDNYTVVLPRLEARGFVATFFVITDYVGKPGQMTWDELREMQDAGMNIGSHTLRHPDLTIVNDARLTDELAGSRAAIEAKLGIAPAALAYPAGRFNGRVTQAASTAGYILAVTTLYGADLEPEEALELPRMAVSPRESLADFARSLE